MRDERFSCSEGDSSPPPLSDTLFYGMAPYAAQTSDSAIFIRKGTAQILKGKKEVAKRTKGDLIGEVSRHRSLPPLFARSPPGSILPSSPRRCWECGRSVHPRVVSLPSRERLLSSPFLVARRSHRR